MTFFKSSYLGDLTFPLFFQVFPSSYPRKKIHLISAFSFILYSTSLSVNVFFCLRVRARKFFSSLHKYQKGKICVRRGTTHIFFMVLAAWMFRSKSLQKMRFVWIIFHIILFPQLIAFHAEASSSYVKSVRNVVNLLAVVKSPEDAFTIYILPHLLLPIHRIVKNERTNSMVICYPKRHNDTMWLGCLFSSDCSRAHI